jgi:hypothetical protein
MDLLIPSLIFIPVAGFWLWMFRDMLNNDYLPASSPTPLSWPPSTKSGWTIAFILLSIFAALWYYMVEYRSRHV